MIKKIAIGLLAVIGLIYVLVTIDVNSSDCYDIQKAVVTSPDGQYEAKYNQNICGSKPTRMEIFVGGRRSRRSALVFSALATTTEQVQLTWEDNSHLTVAYPESMAPTYTNDRVFDLSIKFRKGEQ